MLSSLASTIRDLVVPGKGFLAADESFNTIQKRFDTIPLPSTAETRAAYREMLFTAPNLNQSISGVILFEETLGQRTSQGVPFPTFLQAQGMIPGIKVDEGLVPLEKVPDEKVTLGLDGLASRLERAKTQGARFAKWRAVISIDPKKGLPSSLAIETNAGLLARYAAICQEHEIVPIVEPEVLIDGDHTIEECASVSESVLDSVFEALYRHRVTFEEMILKPSMVTPGKSLLVSSSPEAIAEATVAVFRRTIPAAVPGIYFLSGGQSETISTENLRAINQLGPHPWVVSFSYGRALQDSALRQWAGKASNIAQGQEALLDRARKNSNATRG